MKTVNTHSAKTHFSGLLKEVSQGEEVIIARAGKPVARLIPYTEKSAKVGAPGALATEDFWMADDFDDSFDELFDALD